jgi:hypothetical protein
MATNWRNYRGLPFTNAFSPLHARYKASNADITACMPLPDCIVTVLFVLPQFKAETVSILKKLCLGRTFAWLDTCHTSVLHDPLCNNRCRGSFIICFTQHVKSVNTVA